MRKGRKTLWWLLAVMLAGFSLLLSVVPAVSARDAIVHLSFFYSEDCDHCREIKNELFPALLAQYGSGIEISALEISDATAFEQMLAMEQRYGVTPEQADVPEVFIGEYALVGVEEIRAKLPGLIAGYLAQGGADLLPLSAVNAAQSDDPVVCFYLFYGETCPHCHEVMDNFLPQVYQKYGDQVEHQYFEIWNDTDNYVTLLGLEMKLGVSEDYQGAVPALVIGDKVLVGGDEIPDKLESYIDEYLAQGGMDCPSLEDLPEVIVPTPAPSVEILVAFDPNHADFSALNALLVSLGQEYGSGLKPYPLDVTQGEGAAILDHLNRALKLEPPPAGTPQILIDRRMLVGMEEIERELPGLIDKYLAEGGIRVPTWEQLEGGNATPSATPIPSPIYLAYFEKAGCQECARTTYDLRVVEERYPQVIVDSFSMEEPDSTLLNECLSERYGVPEEKRLSTPMIFVGEDVLIGREANLQNLLGVVEKYASTGAERTWEDMDIEGCRANIIDRPSNWTVLTVLGAGLIDGLNPCAFATLIFFVSYLAFTGRRGRDILFVGAAFALGVFLTYLLVGVGLLKVVQSLSFFTALGRWVYFVTALLCVVLATLTFRDFLKARKGQTSEMTLKLPLSLRRQINKVIRESAQTRAFVAMAFITGFVVSLIELACTGQVYLPTIVYVLSVPEMAARAYLFLVLYCLAFILPLIVVFALSYFGTTSEQLGQFVNRHTSTIKLITGLVFVGLAVWMTWTLAPLFGIHSPWNWVLMAGVLVVIAVSVVVLYIRDRRAPKGKKTRPRQRRSRA
jgi:cytochrome c biogenesis protein CcdA/glutaredoxin